MKKRWFVAVALVVGGLIFTALTLMKDAPTTGATLSDGSTVQLLKVGFGAMPYDSFPPLKAALAQYVPNRWKSRLGERIQVTFNFSDGALGLLFDQRIANGQRKTTGNQFLSRIEFIESKGFVFDRKVYGYGSSGGVMLIREQSFPRRDPVLHMRLYEQGTEKLLFDVRVPNPDYKSSVEEWTPAAFPATQTVKPLTVTLKRGPASLTETLLRDEDYELTSTDLRWTATRPARQVWLTDATGNHAYDFSGLSPFEPAWKLNIRFRRNPAAEFGDDEVWRTKLVAMPAALTAVRLNAKQVVAGVELSVAYVSATGQVQDDGSALTVVPTTVSFQGGVSTGSGSASGKNKAYTFVEVGQPFFSLSHSTLDDDTELIVTVRDQTGTVLSSHSGNSNSYGGSGQWTRLIQFTPTADTTDVHLEVIVNRGRTFEFLVTPPKPANVSVP